MRFYISCFRADGSQILGNGDGQRALECRNYKRTIAYKSLREIVGNPRWLGGRVAEARIENEKGEILEVIR